MSLKIGNNDTVGVFLGDLEVSSMFLGEDVVYSSGDWVFVPLDSSYQRSTSDPVGYGVKQYKGTSNTVTIPSEYKGLPIISIEKNFDKKHVIEDLTIPNTVEIIKSDAFSDYYYTNVENNTLQYITFENNSSLEIIETRGIYHCTALDSLSLPNSVTSIANEGICNNGLTTLFIGSGLEYLGTKAFYNNASLTTVTMAASSVTSIPQQCFQNCVALTTVSLPNNITTLDQECFSGCSLLASITLPSSLTTLGNSCFTDCTVLNNVSVPNSVANWGIGCFAGCNALDTITLPAGLTEIPASTFSHCAFTSFTFIPSSVTSFGAGAFSSNGFTDFTTFPTTVTSIGTECFSGCNSLTSVLKTEIPNVVGEYDNWFKNCAYLTTLSLPDGITAITLTNNDRLNNLDLGRPSRIKGIHYCNALRTLVLPNSVTTVDSSGLIKLWYLTSLTLSDSMTEVPSHMFAHDPGWSEGPVLNYLQTLNLGSGITRIGDWAFSGCPNISPLIIPDQVTYIDHNAFDGSYYGNTRELTPSTVVVGSGLATSSTRAFRVLTGMNAIYYRGTPAKWCQIDWGGTDGGFVLFNNNFANAPIYILDPNGDVTYNNETYSEWKNVIVPEGITSLGYGAFYNHVRMKSISLPDSLTSISFSSYYATFKNCKSLQVITLETTTAKDYLNDLYNFNFGGVNDVHFRIHLSLIPVVEQLGWAHDRYSVIEEVLLTGINSDNWPDTFEGERFWANPQYEPYYANKVEIANGANTTEILVGSTWPDGEGGYTGWFAGGYNGGAITSSSAWSWVSTVDDPNVATVGISTDVDINQSVTSPTNLTITTYDFPQHVYECSKTIKVKYMNQDITYDLSGAYPWAASSGETVSGNQVYKNPVNSTKNRQYTMKVVFEGYTHFEIAVRCNANSNSYLYVYDTDSTSSRKATYNHTDKYYNRIIFDGLTTDQHYIQITFNKGNTTSTDTSSLDQCGRMYVISENCY